MVISVYNRQLVTEPGAVSARWGAALAARLALLAAWAERQGLELAADCHLARTHQAGQCLHHIRPSDASHTLNLVSAPSAASTPFAASHTLNPASAPSTPSAASTSFIASIPPYASLTYF